jgi:hypothetical protein
MRREHAAGHRYIDDGTVFAGSIDGAGVVMSGGKVRTISITQVSSAAKPTTVPVPDAELADARSHPTDDTAHQAAVRQLLLMRVAVLLHGRSDERSDRPRSPCCWPPA